MILIYSEENSARLKYTLKLIFHDILKTDYTQTNDAEGFIKSRGPKINYSMRHFENAIHIIPAKLLFEQGIVRQQIELTSWEGLPVFYQTDASADFPFDPLAMSFFMVSRYEEYGFSENLDKHGRFQAEESVAYKNQFLLQPLVNQLAIKIKELILMRYSTVEFRPSTYSYFPTIDVDMAFSYLGKGVMRNIGGFLKSLIHFQFSAAIERIKVLTGLMPDPFNNFNMIVDQLKTHEYEPCFFLNLGNYGKFDKNIPFENLRFFRLLQSLNEKAQLCIHPSYASNYNHELLKEEIAKLEHIKGSDVIKSRQHFLILNLPETYRNLIQLGIVEDYSMGYASQAGFRAGICTPFRFYDLLAEEETLLQIYPFAFMDGSLTDYMKLDYEEMINLILQISNTVKQVEGNLIGIWHNSAIAEHKDIHKLFIKSLSILK